MCHNKIDLIPLKLSSIIMNLLTPLICNEFSETPLYTLLETMDCPENQNQNPQNYLMSAPPSPPLPGEKIMTGPLDLNRRFSRGEGGGRASNSVDIFLCCFSCLETVEYIKAQSFLHILSMITWRSFIAMSQSFRILHFFLFFSSILPISAEIAILVFLRHVSVLLNFTKN